MKSRVSCASFYLKGGVMRPFRFRVSVKLGNLELALAIEVIQLDC